MKCPRVVGVRKNRLWHVTVRVGNRWFNATNIEWDTAVARAMRRALTELKPISRVVN